MGEEITGGRPPNPKTNAARGGRRHLHECQGTVKILSDEIDGGAGTGVVADAIGGG